MTNNSNQTSGYSVIGAGFAVLALPNQPVLSFRQELQFCPKQPSIPSATQENTKAAIIIVSDNWAILLRVHTIDLPDHLVLKTFSRTIYKMRIPKQARRVTSSGTAQETSTPPQALEPTQSIVRVIKSQAHSLYLCALPDKKEVLVELPLRFRNAVWIKRGGYLLIDTKGAIAEYKDTKIDGEIINVVREENAWRKQAYWPKEFPKSVAYDEGTEDEEESQVGKMPPSDSESE
ncbi:hypothetical protein BJ878DRAFT_478209 [Calycina marina]|uniref:S1-like domain-containing protein n=1 Tax=Calycina marina TaxID=1763456 RepID=A0A9P7Z6N4_9HELO|nr:hypothetical protein BJ878DRAFT_478209 [Calycina marina]